MNAISGSGALHLTVKNDGFRKGQVLDGVVINVNEDGIAAVNLAGKTITVASGSEMLQVGETIRLKVTELTGDGVFATRVNLKETTVLNKLGIPVNDENLIYISELIKNNQPIDKELLSRLLKNTQEVKLLTELLQSGAEISDVDAPIRRLIITMLQNQNSGASQGVSANRNSVFNQEIALSLNPNNPLTSAADVQGTSLAGAAVREAPISAAQPDQNSPVSEIRSENLLNITGRTMAVQETKVEGNISTEQGFNVPESDGQNSGVRSDSVSESKNDKAAGEPVPGKTDDLQTLKMAQNSKEALSDFSRNTADLTDKAVGHNHPQTVHYRETVSGEVHHETTDDRNMIKKESALKILFSSADSGELTIAVKNLIQRFDAKDNIALAIQNRTLNLRNLAQIQLNVSDITEKIMEISKELNGFSDISAMIKDLENGHDLEHLIFQRYPKLKMISEAVEEQSRQEHPGIYYISLPVHLMGEERRTDMYFKRSPKKSNELSILVALKTMNLGEVRCLVYKADHDYTLGFALENERITSLLRDKITNFKSGIGNLQIVFRTREETDKIFFEKKEAVSNCDLRV